MKVVILAGGMQSTINNENEGIPKPMVDVGGRPLLWHIMKQFSGYGSNEFIVCGGYRVDMIKEYFMDYYIYASDITVDLQKNTIEIHKKRTEDWKVTVVDTGLSTTTGQRVNLIRDYIQEEEFIVVYGDCLSDVNVEELIEVHRRSGKIATLTMAKPMGRNRLLPIDDSGDFTYDKDDTYVAENAWVNADCLVFGKQIFEYLDESADLEKGVLMVLSEQQQLATYKHRGFWRSIETKRDLARVEKLWNDGEAPWIRE